MVDAPPQAQAPMVGACTCGGASTMDAPTIGAGAYHGRLCLWWGVHHRRLAIKGWE